jgi:iron complex outermembrane recepter protein
MQLHRRWLAVLAALSISPWTVTHTAQNEAAEHEFSLAKGSLRWVLDQFAIQGDISVITQPNVSEIEVGEIGPFIGRATPDAAMSSLLKGSPLSYTWQGESTIRIFATDVRPPRSENNVQQVLVTGTRLAGVDGPATVRVHGKARIDRYGVSTLSDFSRYLTQQPFSFSGGYQQSSAQYFQMRGLGFDTTLVLINGRRVPPSANSIALNAVDVNTIPVVAVDRVEVMADSASAIYGADAIGGVVNIVLKDRIEEPEVYLHYGQAQGGSTQRRAAVSVGATRDRLKSMLVLDYYETTALMGEERDLWRNQDYRRFGGRDYRVTATNPGNVYSLSGPLPGLSSTHAAVPVGASGYLSPADFLATDGAVNLESSFKERSITPAVSRASGYGSAEYSLTPTTTVFGEVLAATSELSAQRGPPSMSGLLVPASNPFNPFGVPVVVDFSFAGMKPIVHVYETDLLRLAGGARGRFGQWSWEISGLSHGETAVATTLGTLDVARVTAMLNSDDPQIALNVFSDGQASAYELLESLRSSPYRSNYSFSSTQLSAFARGPVFGVGERTAELVIGGEWRRDTANFFEFSGNVDVRRNTASFFLEIRVPLLEKVTLKIAARGDDWGEGEIVNPQYGIVWKPADAWLFRASYGTSFRPPSLFELNLSIQQPMIPISDPLRGGEVSNVILIVGRNRELELVTARSFSVGFSFSPPEMPGLRLGSNYWRVQMDNRIIVPNYQELMEREGAFAGRVVRNDPTAQDLHEGWPGRLRSIDITRVNYGDLETSGIDFDGSVQVERHWGCLQLDLGVTWVDEYRTHDMNPGLPVERVGIANAQGTIPEWRAIGTLSWKLGAFGASTTATRTPSYRDSDLALGTLDRRIGSQTLVDVQLWTDLNLGGNALFEGSTIALGARNLFDESPEFSNSGASLGHDISQSELTRRFVYFRIGKRF